MIKWLVFFILSLSLFHTKSEKQLQIVKKWDINADFFYTDHLLNIYAINQNEIFKANLKKTEEKKFSKSQAYNIYSIDVSDPFKVLVFYKDFNQILFLDKSLAEIKSPIQLDNYFFYDVVAVCNSASGGFWIFDAGKQQLVYFNNELSVRKKSASLGPLIGDFLDGTKIFMLEKNDYIYLGIKNIGVLMFDNYGSYIKTFPLKIETGFQVLDQNIVYYKSGELFFYDLQKLEQKSIQLPVKKAVNARVENNYLFVQTIDQVLVYQWNHL
ncbi:MAG: hypothetical protein ACLFVR_10825 [Thiohalospira sp.]